MHSAVWYQRGKSNGTRTLLMTMTAKIEIRANLVESLAHREMVPQFIVLVDMVTYLIYQQ